MGKLKRNYFLNSDEIPAMSRNMALNTLMYAEPTITNIVAMMKPSPATSAFLFT